MPGFESAQFIVDASPVVRPFGRLSVYSPGRIAEFGLDFAVAIVLMLL